MSEILNQNIITEEGKKYIFIPHDSDKLLIILSARGAEGKFMHFRGLTNDQNLNLLFVADTKHSWYIGGDKGFAFEKILMKYAKGFENKNVVILGSSMGGYGALLHGIRLGFNIITSNPQTKKSISRSYVEDLNKTNFIDINEVVGGVASLPPIYYIHGRWEPDYASYLHFIKSISKAGIVISESVDVSYHTYFFTDVKEIYKRVNLLISLRETHSSPIKKMKY